MGSMTQLIHEDLARVWAKPDTVKNLRVPDELMRFSKYGRGVNKACGNPWMIQGSLIAPHCPTQLSRTQEPASSDGEQLASFPKWE